MGSVGFPGSGVYGPPHQLSRLTVGPGSLSVDKQTTLRFQGKHTETTAFFNAQGIGWEGPGEVVSRQVVPITHMVILAIPIVKLLTKSL